MAFDGKFISPKRQGVTPRHGNPSFIFVLQNRPMATIAGNNRIEPIVGQGRAVVPRVPMAESPPPLPAMRFVSNCPAEPLQPVRVPGGAMLLTAQQANDPVFALVDRGAAQRAYSAAQALVGLPSSTGI